MVDTVRVCIGLPLKRARDPPLHPTKNPFAPFAPHPLPRPPPPSLQQAPPNRKESKARSTWARRSPISMRVLSLPATSRIRAAFVATCRTNPELSDTRVYVPRIRAHLGTTAHFCQVVVLKLTTVLPPECSLFPRLARLLEGVTKSQFPLKAQCFKSQFSLGSGSRAYPTSRPCANHSDSCKGSTRWTTDLLSKVNLPPRNALQGLIW